jgi:hypothetical protein
MNEANNFLQFIQKLHKLATWFTKEVNMSIPLDARFYWYDPITENFAKSAIILKQYSRKQI